MYRPPTALTATRAFKWAGVTIAKGATFTGPYYRGMQHLLARRWLVPTPDTYGPVGDPTTPTPTYVSGKLLKKVV